MINGLHAIFPVIPDIPTKRRNINYLLTEPPWNALKSYGYITVSFYPFMIGLGFLMPLDLSFSCWFFFVVSKITLIFTTMIGWQSRPRVPFYDEQAFGAFLSICVFAMWSSRQHLHQIVLKALGQSRIDDSTGRHHDVHGIVPARFSLRPARSVCTSASGPGRTTLV